jgi:heptaprenyl diphosphate synthase
MERVNEYMHKIAANPFVGTPTGDVLEDVLRSSGKMIRPRLLLLCSAFGPGAKEREERICMLAAMVELTHMASLIHDDIIDDAPYRRGQPSIQGKYGKDAAVYAGDFLIERVHYWQSKEHMNDASMILSQTVESMCIGEIGQATCRYDEHVAIETYMDNIRRKTASLFAAACTLGAKESGCDEDTAEKLKQFGEYLGIMFQLRDDLLDYTSSKSAEGKVTHKDFRDGIYTFPLLASLETPDGGEVLLPLMRANAKRSLSTEEIEQMEQNVVRYGGLTRTVAEIHQYASQAREILDSLRDIPESGDMREILDRLVEI